MSNKNYNQTINPIDELTDNVCYHLALVNYFYNRTEKLNFILDNTVSCKETARRVLSFLYRQKRLKRVQELATHSGIPTAITTRIATNIQNKITQQDENDTTFSTTKEIVETLADIDPNDYILPFHQFELVATTADESFFGSHKFDSIAHAEYLAQHNGKFLSLFCSNTSTLTPNSQNNALQSLRTHSFQNLYRPVESHLPLIETKTPLSNPQRALVDLLYSKITPAHPRYHRIWISKNLYIRTKFRTKQSFSDYMEQHPMEERELMQLIHWARSIEQQISKIPTHHQKTDAITEQFHQFQLETAIRQHQHLSEIHMLLATENLDDLVNHLANLNNAGSQSNKQSRISTLYTPSRNSLSHTGERGYNPEKELPNFINNTITELSQFSGRTPDDINKIISLYTKLIEHNGSNTQPDAQIISDLSKLTNKSITDIQKRSLTPTRNANDLILLFDELRILRQTWTTIYETISNTKLSKNTNVFLATNIITPKEANILLRARVTKNDLCHGDPVTINTNMSDFLRILNKIYIHIVNTIHSLKPKMLHTVQQALNNQFNQYPTAPINQPNDFFVHPNILNIVNNATGNSVSGNNQGDFLKFIIVSQLPYKVKKLCTLGVAATANNYSNEKSNHTATQSGNTESNKTFFTAITAHRTIHKQ